MLTSYNADDQLLNPKEMITAIELMFRRMEMIDGVCLNNFPLYSPRDTNAWAVSAGGSWMGGFWSACWWLRAKITESPSDQCKAANICQQLTEKIHIDSGNRSLIFWYGAALGKIWFRDAHARALTKESTAAFAASFDPAIQSIPLGTALGGGKEGNRHIAIDNFATLIQLLGSSQQKEHEEIARRHTDTLLATCRHSNGAFHAHVHFDGNGFHPDDQAGAWSRGQAWAMLGLSRAAAQWGEPYLTFAKTACEYWQHSRPHPLSPNRLDQPSHFDDPSATVIASLAMLSLARLVSDAEQWRADAHHQITAIIRSQYFTGFPKDNKYSQSRNNPMPGIFWGCCYKTQQDKEELVESAWGNFFLLAALCILIGFIEPDHC